MSAKSSLVVLGGAGLIGANIWFGPANGSPLQVSSVWPYWTSPNSGVNSTEAYHETMTIVAALIGVWILSVIAEDSDFAADIVLTFIGGLWLLWLIGRGGNPWSHTGGTTSGPGTGSTPKQKGTKP